MGRCCGWWRARNRWRPMPSWTRAAEQEVLEQILERTKPHSRAWHGATRITCCRRRFVIRRWQARLAIRFTLRAFDLLRFTARKHTVLAEGAFYRFWFWQWHESSTQKTISNATHHIQGRLPNGTRLSVAVSAIQNICRRHCAIPCNYGETQALGKVMRAAGMRSVRVRFGARSGVRPERGDCFIRMLCHHRKRILRREEWACTTDSERVVFYFTPVRRATREFSLELLPR
jgi:hypothetical protein